MQYISTRGRDEVTSQQAILRGIAPDGGLYVPQGMPHASRGEIHNSVCMPYAKVAARVLAAFLTDYDYAELDEICRKAYGAQFDDPAIAPLAPLGEGKAALELFHGPTLAFKDMALQILPYLMTTAIREAGETDEIMILVATSGDTGKAALEGFCDVPGTSIAVFFPQDGVSVAQKLQMVTQEGGNVAVFAVRGNFDDAQTGVKRIFTSDACAADFAKRGVKMSSANSINWGRLAPQIAYYFFAYAEAHRTGKIAIGERINFVVPTGNFGNILAGYYAKRMGLPVNKLICASNRNNVLTDFFNTGAYDRDRTFYQTSSPSMDILISSNLERLLFEVGGKDPAKLRAWMEALKSDGHYSVGADVADALHESFYAGWADEPRVMAAIAKSYGEGYLMDPHTAVGRAVYDEYADCTGDNSYTVLVSTASPFKFSSAVLSALGRPTEGRDEFDMVEELAKLGGLDVPRSIEQLRSKPVLHNEVCDPQGMEDVLSKWVAARKGS